MEWLNGDESWRADIGKNESKETVHEMKRWKEGKIGRERESHLTRVMWCISRCCISPLPPLSLSLSLSHYAVFCSLCTNNWFMLSMRERPALANTNDSRIGLSAKQRDIKHSNFIACTCINRNQNVHASNTAYLAQHYIFSFHYTINYRLIRLNSCHTFSAPPG